jgi:hypothetical protein
MVRNNFPFIFLCIDSFCSHSFLMFLLLFLSSILLLSSPFPSSAWPGQISSTGDAKTGPNVAGYKNYCGPAPRIYGFPINVGNGRKYTATALMQRHSAFWDDAAYKMDLALWRLDDGKDYVMPSSGVRRWEQTWKESVSMMRLVYINRHLNAPFPDIPFLAILFSPQHFCSNCIFAFL